MEQLDKDITYILNYAWKKVERRRRGISYSKEKARKIACLRYWKGRLGLLQSKQVLREALFKRREFLEMPEQNQLSIEQIKENIKNVEEDWSEFKTKSKRREKERAMQ